MPSMSFTARPPTVVATRPAPDSLLVDIADYVLNYRDASDLALETAYHCLLDSLACALQALKYPACTKLLGPVVPGATMARGARVPGTSYELDPVQAAFNLGRGVGSSVGQPWRNPERCGLPLAKRTLRGAHTAYGA
jgi:2-methylcitrate dehydratase